MTNRNVFSKSEYMVEHFFWISISMFWFKSILFRNIAGMTYEKSQRVFWLILAGSALIGIAGTWKKRRNRLSLFVNVLMPYEIYLIIVYQKTASVMIKVLFCASLLLSAVYMLLVLTPQIKKGFSKVRIIRRRLARALSGARSITVCCFTVLVLAVGISSAFEIALPASAAAENRLNREDMTIAKNIQVLSQLDEDCWKDLSIQEKLKTLQTAADIEAAYFGLPHELEVVPGTLPEDTLASYNKESRVIAINTELFEHGTAHENLDALCHEARHAYQCCLCDVYDGVSEEQKDLLVFYDVRIFQQEFSDYADGKEDVEAYGSQSCEEDARRYAHEAVADYYSRIEAYLKDR